jgi:hypothetical protein
MILIIAFNFVGVNLLEESESCMARSGSVSGDTAARLPLEYHVPQCKQAAREGAVAVNQLIEKLKNVILGFFLPGFLNISAVHSCRP